MKYWEFLIQKEGDQTWLPLETQQVEILEGRYRVVAHTDRANTSMDVRVSQLVADEMPPRRRVRKRISTTNDSGLVLVMPFVAMKPGQWDLKCSALEGAGEAWQYSVQLQVFAHTEEDWSDEWPVPNDYESVSSITLEGDEDVDPDLINRDLPLIQARAELEANSPDIHEKVVAFPSYQVALKQQAYLAHPKLPMTIVGKVSALAQQSQVGEAHAESHLWIRLQNPETARVIMEASRPLSLMRLPADFKVQIQLPTEVPTRVVLGEVSLRSHASKDSTDGGKVFASTPFTISAGIAELLEAIANQDAEAFSGVFEEEVSMPSLTSVHNTVSPAVGVVLPPKLDQIDYMAIAAESEDAQHNGHARPALPNFDSANNSVSDAKLIVSDAPSPTEPAETWSEPAFGHSSPDAHTQDPLSQAHSSREQLSEQSVPSEPLSSEPVTPRAPMVAQPAQFLGTSVEDSDIEADEITAVLEDIDNDLSSDESELDALEAPGVEAALPIVSARSQPHNSTLTEEQAANLAANEAAREANKRSHQQKPDYQPPLADFQALRMKDHFWNRLSNLTHDSHQEALQVSEQMREAGVTRDQQNFLSSPVARASSEVVIYSEPEPDQPSAQPSLAESHEGLSSSSISQYADEPSVSAPEGRSSIVDRLLANKRHSESATAASGGAQPPTQAVSQPPISASLASTIEPADLPEMALPVISVPIGDLIAGDIITVTVRTRPSVYKPFIKLWVVDRQSRSLVVEPKILANMTPDALGDLETSTQLQIPMHCLDVQIAAIAIDMATQQESAKAIVNRHVIPASQTSPLRDASI